jgi:CDP-diacylglycerol pyrophosphatase
MGFITRYKGAVAYWFSGQPHIALECATAYGIWRLIMRKIWLCGFMVIIFASCGQKVTEYAKSTPEEKWEIIQEYCMASDASASTESPLPNVLSEQEVLLKAADFAIAEGVLDPSYYAYQTNPALMDAKIETPILMTDASSGVLIRIFFMRLIRRE